MKMQELILGKQLGGGVEARGGRASRRDDGRTEDRGFLYEIVNNSIRCVALARVETTCIAPLPTQQGPHHQKSRAAPEEPRLGLRAYVLGFRA